MWKLVYRTLSLENTVYSESQLELELLKSTLENKKLVSYASLVTFDHKVRVVK